MARSGGPTADGPTKSVRMFAAEAELLYWIGEVTGVNSAKILSPVVLPSLSAMYERHRPAIERLKAMRAEAERIREAANLLDAGVRIEFSPELGEPPSSGEPPPPKRRRPRAGE